MAPNCGVTGIQVTAWCWIRARLQLRRAGDLADEGLHVDGSLAIRIGRLRMAVVWKEVLGVEVVLRRM